MTQFLMDIKRGDILGTKLFNGTMPGYSTQNSYNSGALNLSRTTHHRDSVETRQTPSPSNTSSFSSTEGSPTTTDRLPQINCIVNQNINQISSFPYKPEHQMSDHYKNVYLPSTRIEGYVSSLPIVNSSISSSVGPVFRSFPIIPFRGALRHTPSPSSQTHGGQSNEQLSSHHQIYKSNDQNELNEKQILSSSGQIKTEPNNISETCITTTSNTTTVGGYPMMIGRDGKLSRPFKAYPHDPLSIAASFTATDTLLDTQSAEKYTTFRKRMLEQIHAANGGQPTISNPKMKRTPSKQSIHQQQNDTGNLSDASSSYESPFPGHSKNDNNNNNSDSSNYNNMVGMVKDTAYFERRKKNNAAAKKSRDRRRIKEDEIAIRAAFLERENIELKFELTAIRKQLALYGATTMT